MPPTLLIPHKIHASSVHVIFAALLLQHTTYTTNYFPPEVKSPWSTWVLSGVPILLCYPPSTPRCLSKDNPINGFAFSYGERNPPWFSQPLPMYSMGTLSPPPVCRGFVWAGPGRFADLVLSSQVASVKFTSQSFHAPLPNTYHSLQQSVTAQSFQKAYG